MIEIIGGGGLANALESLGIQAKCTFKSKYNMTPYKQVWEIREQDFDILCNVPEDQWHEDWGWFRYSSGANLGPATEQYMIGGQKVLAWDGYKHEIDEDGYDWREYSDLTEYLELELGASTESNVCSVVTEMAKQNDMTIAQLLQKYEG